MNQTSVYENAAVTTQNKGRLIIMLYDGAIKFLNQAIHALETGDMEAKGKYIGRAQEIVIELNTILNMELRQTTDTQHLFKQVKFLY